MSIVTLYHMCKSPVGLKVGEDANADLLRGSLSEAGVDLQHLRTVKGPSGSAVILLQPSGQLLQFYADEACVMPPMNVIA